jgi:DnaK suppressor protein
VPELTPEQKQHIASTLAQRRSQLIDEIRGELARAGHQHFADLAGEVTDAGDASVADLLVDQDIALVGRQVKELTQIETAQKRLNGAEYGACEACGAEIGVPRLLAVPFATRCIGCQEQHDKMFSHESTPKL